MKGTPANGRKGVPDFYLVLGAQFTILHFKYATILSKELKTMAMARCWMGSYLEVKKR